MGIKKAYRRAMVACARTLDEQAFDRMVAEFNMPRPRIWAEHAKLIVMHRARCNPDLASEFTYQQMMESRAWLVFRGLSTEFLPADGTVDLPCPVCGQTSGRFIASDCRLCGIAPSLS
jgi:hypothetical protein